MSADVVYAYVGVLASYDGLSLFCHNDGILYENEIWKWTAWPIPSRMRIKVYTSSLIDCWRCLVFFAGKSNYILFINIICLNTFLASMHCNFVFFFQRSVLQFVGILSWHIHYSDIQRKQCSSQGSFRVENNIKPLESVSISTCFMCCADCLWQLGSMHWYINWLMNCVTLFGVSFA